VVAAVRRAGTGRLGGVTVAVPFSFAAAGLLALLAAPESWHAFPGWKKVKALAGDRIQVQDNLPFVDFETIWQLRRDRAAGFSAVTTSGAIQGAQLAWDVWPRVSPVAGNAARSLAVLSLYPRVETAGYIPRKFIAAEPLLEHGIALALAYVDAMSMAAELDQGTQNPTR
jgi:hypothetical protein